MKSPDQAITYHKYRQGKWETIGSHVIVEAPVSLNVNGVHWLTFMCTPTDLKELAVGFLFNEGMISTKDDVAVVDVCASGDNVDVWLKKWVEKPPTWQRTTGCSGGVTSVKPEGLEPVDKDDSRISPLEILSLMEQFLAAQTLYRQTRGVHASALSDGKSIVIAGEDIGRHNTLDKIAGSFLLQPQPLDRRILLTTGRISSEMLQKAARMRASVLISRTAPNSFSIQLADLLGITLIGYARRNEFNVYSHASRLMEIPFEKEITVTPFGSNHSG